MIQGAVPSNSRVRLQRRFEDYQSESDEVDSMSDDEEMDNCV